MSFPGLRAAIAAQDVAQAARLWGGYYGTDINACLDTELTTEEFIWLMRSCIANGYRAVFMSFGRYIPLLHVAVVNAKVRGRKQLFAALLEPRNRDWIDLEASYNNGAPYDVRRTALRYAMEYNFGWGIKRLLLAGASRDAVVSTADNNNMLAPYLQRRASCTRLACALLWRDFRPFGLVVPRDLRVLLAHIVWRKRYSKRWE